MKTSKYAKKKRKYKILLRYFEIYTDKTFQFMMKYYKYYVKKYY